VKARISTSRLSYGGNRITLPASAVILGVGYSGSGVRLWYSYEEGATELLPREFFLVGTGGRVNLNENRFLAVCGEVAVFERASSATEEVK